MPVLTLQVNNATYFEIQLYHLDLIDLQKSFDKYIEYAVQKYKTTQISKVERTKNI